ncbi:hypothetical protein L7F22_042864 [Adiantum nelumboides]|nr:hypothetical protein [Adiantum nelumboides]
MLQPLPYSPVFLMYAVMNVTNGDISKIGAPKGKIPELLPEPHLKLLKKIKEEEEMEAMAEEEEKEEEQELTQLLVENQHPPCRLQIVVYYFDGAYKQKVDKASVGISIQDEDGQKVFGKGLLVENTHSNNEAEYVALALGLEWCVSMGIKRLNVFGDALLLIKQVHGTWACRNQSLVPRLRRVKELMKRFEAIQLYHVPRKENQEADALASVQLQEVIVGAIKLQNPLFQGSDCMHDIVNFLETGECTQDMSKGQRQWLVRKATKYRLINKHLYCKGKDLVLRRVPHSKDIKQVLTSCHEGVCGDHFAHDITSRKIF